MGWYSQLQAASTPEQNQKLKDLMQYTANESYGGTPQDWQAEIFGGLDPTSIKDVAKTVDLQNVDRSGLQLGDQDNILGYTDRTKPITTSAGTQIYANYDELGNLKGFSGNDMQRSFTNGSTSYSGQWDPTGKATPQLHTSGSGSFLGGLMSNVSDLANSDLGRLGLAAGALYAGGAFDPSTLGATELGAGAAGGEALGGGLGTEMTASQAADMIAAEQAGSMTAEETLAKIAQEQGTSAAAGGAAAAAGAGAAGAGGSSLLGAGGAALAGAAAGGGAFPWLQTGLGLADMYGKQQASKALNDRYNQVNQQINSMYAPGSPEYEALKNEMARKDAAAGRNSQYGTRLSEMGAKIAANKGNLLAQTLGSQNNLLAAQLATGNSSYGSLANLFGQNSMAPGVNAANAAIGSGMGWGLDKLMNAFGSNG